MNKLKLLITGSCGFILGNFIRKAIYENHPYYFVSLDRVNTESLGSIYLNKSHIFHIADIKDQHVIDKIFQYEKPDIVLHGADTNFSTDNNEYINSNILGTQIVINACLKNKVQRLLYLSTDKVFGSLSGEQSDRWDEDSPVNPSNVYSVSKVSGELLVKSSGLNYNIIRLSSNYGPRQNVKQFIPKTIKSILGNEKIQIFGEGRQVRDWTHVFDTCSAILTILEKGASNKIYNVSSNQELAALEVVQKICNVMEKGHSSMEFINSVRKPDFRRSMKTDNLLELGWNPSFKFSDGLVQTCSWFQANQWALKD